LSGFEGRPTLAVGLVGTAAEWEALGAAEAAARVEAGFESVSVESGAVLAQATATHETTILRVSRTRWLRTPDS
jgi:hypothetical protein